MSREPGPGFAEKNERQRSEDGRQALSTELEKLLEQHRLEGELQSSGAFTLDRQAMSRKLSQFLLPDPYAYVLKFVQWAVAAEAKKVKIEVSGKRVLFAHDGYPPKKEWLLGWQENLLSSDGAQAGLFGELRDLALGLRSLQELEPTKVEYVCRGRLESFDVVFGDDGDWLREGLPASQKNLSIISVEGRTVHLGSAVAADLRHYRSEALQRLSKNFQWAELSLLKSCCKHCPIPVQVNGRWMNQPLFGLATSSNKLDRRWNFRRPLQEARPAEKFYFRVIEEDKPHLLAPTVHSATARTLWSSFGLNYPVADIVQQSGHYQVEKALKRFAPNWGFWIEGGPPANSDLQMVHRFQEKGSRVGLLATVVRGVTLHIESDPRLPNNSYALQSDFGMKTDISGLKVLKNAAWTGRLAWIRENWV